MSTKPVPFSTDGRARLSAAPATAHVVIAGDLCPIKRVEPMLSAGDIRGVFGGCLNAFKRADLNVVNLESPLAAVASPIPKLGPNFRVDPAVASALRAAGISVCCLANNHIMDQGAAGLESTISALERAGLMHLGASADMRTAGEPLCITVRGIKLALLNFGIMEGAIAGDGPGAARVNYLAIRRAVAEARAANDVVIPILHVGKEEVLFPAPGIRELCRELLDAGAAAVVGHHPHVPQGIEIHKGKPIAYSLGNFIFDWPDPEPHTDTSYLLELGIAPEGVVEVAAHPIIKSKTGGVDLMSGEARGRYIEFLGDISVPLYDDAACRRLWEQQCRVLFERWFKPRLARGAELGAEDQKVRQKAQLTFLNLLEDAEHAEPIKAALRNQLTGRGDDDPEARATLAALEERLVSFAK